MAFKISKKFIYLKCTFSPGVIITEVHKRGGMSEGDYAKVSLFTFYMQFLKNYHFYINYYSCI